MLFFLLIRVLSTTGARRSDDLSQISLYELVEKVFLYLSVKAGSVWLTLKTFDDFLVKTSELCRFGFSHVDSEWVKLEKSGLRYDVCQKTGIIFCIGSFVVFRR